MRKDGLAERSALNSLSEAGCGSQVATPLPTPNEARFSRPSSSHMSRHTVIWWRIMSSVTSLPLTRCDMQARKQVSAAFARPEPASIASAAARMRARRMARISVSGQLFAICQIMVVEREDLAVLHLDAARHAGLAARVDDRRIVAP